MSIRKSRALGCAPSKMDGTEHVFSAGAGSNLNLPEEYSYVDYMSKVLDQGQDPICVACSVSTYINWRKNMETGDKDDHFTNITQLKNFFKTAGGTSDGLTFKAALRELRHNGIKTKEGIVKIREYAMVNSFLALKHAIIMNGPCLGALPVYDMIKPEFWRKNSDGEYYGGHAISIVGWNKEGFIIRNSWGKHFGKKGYVTIPYSEFKYFFEIWTIV